MSVSPVYQLIFSQVSMSGIFIVVMGQSLHNILRHHSQVPHVKGCQHEFLAVDGLKNMLQSEFVLTQLSHRLEFCRDRHLNVQSP